MKVSSSRIGDYLQKPWLPYVLPFALFLLLTAPLKYVPDLSPQLYIAKTMLVGALLWGWRKAYRPDLTFGLTPGQALTALSCGLLVLVLWIAPEAYLPQLGQPAGFNPHAVGWSRPATLGLILVRLMGASLVVPLMEELFWRSFLMRYLINPDFRSVPLGAFSWFAFLGTSILFGLEHHRVVPGIIAGLLYGLLLIRQKNLNGVILAHGVTNLGLGIYVLLTENWGFW
ncbi:MAG: CAAX prenyl protease-related protein [Desulfobacterales bacterium]